jgi:hypothetical protein
MKKILLSFFIVVMVFFTQISSCFASQSAPWVSGPDDIVKAQTTQTAGLENLGGAMLSTYFSYFITAWSGTGDGQTMGMSGMMTNTVLAMAQKPGNASSVEYLADMGHDLGIMPKEAYAQGSTFAGLSPILELWKTMRDLTYLTYVVIFMIVGFMILLRKKIDPRTVITIEAALPKLIISLILITFSYSIIAFMVDAANLVTRVGGSFFVGTGHNLLGGKSGPEAMNYLASNNLFSLIRPIGDPSKIAETLGQLFQGNTQLGALAQFVNIATWAVFSFASMFITFKIFFSLLGPYVGIVLSIIFAPIQILMMAIPGSEASIGNWLKGVLSKVAVFPVVFFMMLIAATFGARDPGAGISCGLLGCVNWEQNKAFQVGLEKNLNLVMLPFGNWSGIIGEIIAFGILFTIPSAIQLVQNALKVKDPGGDIATQTIRKGMSKVPGLKGLAE